MAPPWLDVLDRVIEACSTQQRPELADDLGRRRARLLDPTVRVLVLGEPNRGKSQLVNALVNAQVCPVSDDVTTGGSTVVRHCESPSAVLVRASHRMPVPIEELAASRSSARSGTGTAEVAEVGIPRRLLANGLVLVDTPPVDGRGPTSAAGRQAADADVVVLASQATDELSATEVALLRRVFAVCPELVVALTKIDLAPHWRSVAERNRARLAGIGVAASVIPVSAELRMHAARTGDHRLNAESGFGELVERLQRAVVTKPTVLAPRSAAVAASAAVEQLVRSLSAEPPPAPGGSAAAQARPLPDVQRELDELRREATRRQTALSDRMADLSADLDFDLRDRARKILREIDRAFDSADPALGWPQFHEWLDARLTEAAQANFGWLRLRYRWIVETLTAGLPEHGRDAPDTATLLYDQLLEQIGEIDKPRLESFGIGQRTFTGLRGSYGGVLMFGLATSLTVGLPLLNPISLAAGVLFGGKTIREEAQARLRRRQAAAKAAAQRYVDDFFLRFGKDCKDVARHAHRALRDHLAAVMESLQHELTASMAEARQAAQADAAERERRRREIEKLVALHERIRSEPALAGSAAGRQITA